MSMSTATPGAGAGAAAEFEDLVGGRSADELDAYFDHREFETRAWLEDQHYWHLYRRELIRQVLDAHRPDRAAPIIELGCGAGTVATHLNQHGRRVDYGDVHAEALRLARRRAEARVGQGHAPLRFVRVDVTRDPPLGGRYRGVLLLDVLEHLPDDVAVMRSIRAQLPPGGGAGGDAPFVLFTVPAFQMLWSPWDDMEKHKRRYTREGAVRLATETGFAVERATYFFFPLFFAAAAVKGARLARRALAGPPPAAAGIAELTEAKSNAALNRAMLALLSAEARWLRRRDLPLGTSVLVLARPTG
jgi:SAM-dependent methyltransferase